MKFVFWTDLHLSGQTPRHRIDDYQFALLQKVSEIYYTAHEVGADFVVSGGDTFNAHRMFSYELLGHFMDIICGYDLDTYFIAGQHDLHGYNPYTYTSSTLCFMINRSRQLHFMDESEHIGDVELVPNNVWEDAQEAATEKLDGGMANVLVTHHLLTNKRTVFDTINTAEFAGWMRKAETEFDLVLSGDLHDGYEVHDVDGMWFCNPGSLARQAVNDMHRTPCYAVIEVAPDTVPVIDVREVEKAQPGSEVFGETAVELLREQDVVGQREFDTTAFVQEMEQFEVESTDICDLVRKAGSSKGLRPEVLRYLEEKAQKTS